MPDNEDRQPDETPAAARIAQQSKWVNAQIEQAIARGEFDDLPGAGKPIPDLDDDHDPDWWLKRLIEREKITGVLPPALGLRNDDAELNQLLDQEAREVEVRRLVEAFNKRVVEARRQLAGGPPVVTPLRDVEEEVNAWRTRRAERREAVQRAQEPLSPAARAKPRRRWWFRRKTEN